MFFMASSLLGKDVFLEWNPNSEADLAGYKVKYGSVSGTYTTTVDVGNVTWTNLVGVPTNANFFVVSAYNTALQESPNSNEATTNDTYLVSWRKAFFSTATDTGDAANLANPSRDSIINLMKFALDLNPLVNTPLNTTTTISGNEILLVYYQNKSATLDGFTFQVQWSDSLVSNSWSSVGVTEVVEQLPPKNVVRRVTAHIPKGVNRRFVRLQVTAP